MTALASLAGSWRRRIVVAHHISRYKFEFGEARRGAFVKLDCCHTPFRLDSLFAVEVGIIYDVIEQTLGRCGLWRARTCSITPIAVRFAGLGGDVADIDFDGRVLLLTARAISSTKQGGHDACEKRAGAEHYYLGIQ